MFYCKVTSTCEKVTNCICGRFLLSVRQKNSVNLININHLMDLRASDARVSGFITC